VYTYRPGWRIETKFQCKEPPVNFKWNICGLPSKFYWNFMPIYSNFIWWYHQSF
jgi:hypothetical protein